jgi:hypothetical protein
MRPSLLDLHAAVTRAAFALALSLLHAAACAAASGTLLISKPVDPRADAWLVDIASGRETPLPRSALAQRRSERNDQWYGSAGSSALVRIDGMGNVDVFDRKTLSRTGGFSLDRLPGVDNPKLTGPLKPSPDGRYLLGYWRPNYRDDEPRLVVFDRSGRVVESGSPYRYERFFASNAFGWLPDGGYLYLAGDKLVLATPGDKVLRSAPVQFPPGVSASGATLEVSPDGRRLLWSMSAERTRRSGEKVTDSLLFVSKLSGSDMRRLTSPSARAREHVFHQLHVSPAWSPGGEAVAFTLRVPNNYAAMPFGGGACQPVYVVPSRQGEVLIDGRDDAAALQMRLPGRTQRVLETCGGVLHWLP